MVVSPTSSSRSSGPGGLLVLAALLVAAGSPALARQNSGSGYASDYDYAGQGDDWYARGPAPGRDYAPPFLDQILSGEDFCQGYERSFDPWWFGPPLFRTNRRAYDHTFRSSAADKTWPCIVGFTPPTCDDGNPCTFDAFDAALARCTHVAERDGLACPDGQFCNGNETCLSGVCVAGTPPVCDDDNACTIDSCDQFTNECFSFPQPPPDEVQNLTLTPLPPGGRTAELTWDSLPGADVYDLYRSASGRPDDFWCFQRDLASHGTVDLGETPDSNHVFLFIPVAVNCAGGGTLGYSSAGVERIPYRPCR